MDTTTTRKSAKIYQFPIKDRAPREPLRHQAEPANYPGMTQACEAAIEGAWYHDEAVCEDERARQTIVPMSFPRQ